MNSDFAQQEDPLTAVLLIDTFDRSPGTCPPSSSTVSLSPEDRPSRTFAPLTLDRPKCLLPVCNVAMIEWVLEWCISCNVKDCLVVGSGLEGLQVKQYFEDAPRWNSKGTWQSLSGASGMKLRIQTFPAKFASFGDALRELDSISGTLPSSNFLLISGGCDMVANWDVTGHFERWKMVRKVDREALMATCCVGAGSAQKSSIPATPTPVYMINPRNGKLIRYIGDELFPDVSEEGKKRFTLGTTSFLKSGEGFSSKKGEVVEGVVQGMAEVQVKTGSSETGVDIITPEVLALFTENFDYNTLRQDFVRGVLSSPVLNKSFYVFDVSSAHDRGHYSARCVSTATWHAIQEDIMRHRCFPLVATALGNVQEYRTHVYRSAKVPLPSYTTLRNCVLIAPSAKIVGSGVIIKDVVTIGPECVIGTGVEIYSSHLMERVKVGQGCKIRESILGNDVELLEGVVLNRGCIIADGVRLGPHVVLPPFTKVTRHSPSEQRKLMGELGWREEWPEDDDEEEDHPVVLGRETNGYLFLLSDVNTARHAYGNDPDDFGDGDNEYFDQRNVMVGELGRTLEDLIKMGPVSIANLEPDSELPSPYSYRRPTPDTRPRLESLQAPVANPSTHAPTPTPHHRYHKIHNHIYGAGWDPDWSEDEENVKARQNQDTESSDEEMGLDHTAMLSASLSQLSLANVQEARTRALNEIRETLIRHLKQDREAKASPGLVASSGVGDALAEVSTARLAENLQWEEVRAVIVACLVDFVVDAVGNGVGKQVQSEVSEVWKKWGELIEKLCFQEVDKIGIVSMIQDHIAQHYSTMASKTFLTTLKTLYDTDVVDENVILKWWEKDGKGDKDAMGKVITVDSAKRAGQVKQLVQPFVEWLETAEEESE